MARLKVLYFAGMKMSLSAVTGSLFLAVIFASCTGTGKEAPPSENNIDAARNFIRAALDGKFDKARNYMLPDSVNINYMDVAERSYQRADQSVKDGYRASSIKIHEVQEPLKDSVTLVVYSNSFRNDPDTLRVLRVNGQWLVDLKYLYEHDTDTLYKKNSQKDTLP